VRFSPGSGWDFATPVRSSEPSQGLSAGTIGSTGGGPGRWVPLFAGMRNHVKVVSLCDIHNVIDGVSVALRSGEENQGKR
jgi:hypothetical protein